MSVRNLAELAAGHARPGVVGTWIKTYPPRQGQHLGRSWQPIGGGSEARLRALSREAGMRGWAEAQEGS